MPSSSAMRPVSRYVMIESSMPMRNFAVTGIPYGVAALTAARMMARNRLGLAGTAAPPPLRVTFCAGQPKFMSM